eukprot:c27361_g1_i1 orf=1437-2036(+)
MKRHFTQDKATRPLSEVSEDQIYSVGLHMDVSSLFSPKSLMGGPLLVAPNPVPPIDKETYWRRNDSSVNAVSFGFVATAILIFMFLVMAIFERILRSRPSIPLVSAVGDSESGFRESPRPQTPIKMDSIVGSTYAVGVSVVMPGQEIPTFIAKPVPIPCPPEGISWPIHEWVDTGSCSCLARSTPGAVKGEDNALSLSL